MHIGITGASGFIGSHLVSMLAGLRDRKVFSFERNNKNLAATTEDLKEFVKNKDIVYHFGGVNRGTDDQIMDGNVKSIFNLKTNILNT